MPFRTDGLFADFITVSPVRKISYEPPVVKSSLKYCISQRIRKNAHRQKKRVSTLSHGENIVLSEIPIGTTYEITEVDGASNGYTVESTNSSGTLTEDTNVSFTNTRNGTVPTAAHTNILISIGLFAIALAGLFWYLRKRKQ